MAHETAAGANARNEVREYLSGVLARAGRNGEIRDEDDLLVVLDSLQLLRMVLELESRYAVSIDNAELTPENLGTIERIAEFLERKRCGGRANTDLGARPR